MRRYDRRLQAPDAVRGWQWPQILAEVDFAAGGSDIHDRGLKERRDYVEFYVPTLVSTAVNIPILESGLTFLTFRQ